MMQAHVRGLLHPQVPACWNPRTDKPMPTMVSNAPVQSTGSSRRSVVGLAMAVRIRAMIAMGMFCLLYTSDAADE